MIASQTLRAAIEEQYAKRLAALSKYTLGRDEIGYVTHQGTYGSMLIKCSARCA